MKRRANRALRICCLSYFALVVITHVVSGIEAEALPPALYAWHTAHPLPAFYSVGGSLCVIASLVATGALLRHKRWAIYLHIASTVLWIALGCSVGPVVSAGLSAPLVAAIFVAAGVIYGLVFFSDALDYSEG